MRVSGMKIHEFSTVKTRKNEKKFPSVSKLSQKGSKGERLFDQRLKNFIEGKYLMCISDNYSVWCSRLSTLIVSFVNCDDLNEE